MPAPFRPEPTTPEEWAVGNYPVVIDPDTTLPTSWSGQPRRDAAGRAAQAALGHQADIPTPAEPWNDYVELLRQLAVYARDEVGGSRFGDGSDGVHTVVGTEVATRDLFYDDLEIPVGTELDMRGWGLYVRGVLVLDGDLHANGDEATGATPGNNTGTPTFGQGATGGAALGGDGADSDPVIPDLTIGHGGAGNGGGEGGGGQAGGTGGMSISPDGDEGGDNCWRTLDLAITGRTRAGLLLQGGASGGGGGGTGSGAGGAGGNVLFVAAHTLEISATGRLRACGGRGGDGSSGNGGGGGNGEGGTIVVITRRGEFAPEQVLGGGGFPVVGLWTFGDGTADVRGSDIDDAGIGLAGQGFGTGADGVVGYAGSVWWLRG